MSSILPPTARSLRTQVKSSPRRNVREGPASQNTSRRSGSVSPSTSTAPGFTIPAFSQATAARHPGPPSVWSSPTFVTTATSPSTTLVAS